MVVSSAVTSAVSLVASSMASLVVSQVSVMTCMVTEAVVLEWQQLPVSGHLTAGGLSAGWNQPMQ